MTGSCMWSATSARTGLKYPTGVSGYHAHSRPWLLRDWRAVVFLAWNSQSQLEIVQITISSMAGGYSLDPPPSFVEEDKPTPAIPTHHHSHSLPLLTSSYPPTSDLTHPPPPSLPPYLTAPQTHRPADPFQRPIGYSPLAGPVHEEPVRPWAVGPRLALLRQSRSLRQIALEAEQVTWGNGVTVIA